jgi:alkylation response protein AidB-like acyl-CoA dehydrogenase
MRFGFSDEQLSMRDAVRGFLEKECPPKVVRDAWTNDTGRSGLWPRLGEMGVLGVLAPEADGGFGGDFLDLVLLLEETGRAALPEPVVEHAAVGMPLLEGTRAAAGATGEITVTVASPGGLVPYADTADLVLAGGDFVDPGTPSMQGHESVDRSRRVFTIDEAPDAGIADDAFDRAALGVAAQLIGLADHMLTMTVEYAKERRQFGVPIGSFQAVKHHLADAFKDLAFARPAVHRAAHSLATGAATRGRDVSMAKAMASDAAWRAGRAALQCHGAIGYTVEHDLHLYLKRSWALAKAWGDAAWHRDRVARAIGA